jgi:maltoporin
VRKIPRFAIRCTGSAPQAVALFVGLIITLAGSDVAAASTEADKLRAEFEALKIENARQAERMRVLEERLRTLETNAQSPTEAPPTAVQALAATDRARVLVEKEYQQDTESRELSLLTADHPYAGRVQEVLQGFMDIHGYFRAGYGRNSNGGSMVGFQAPGASAKYRLGNEADTYGEITFGKNFYGDDAFKVGAAAGEITATNGPIGRFQTTLAAYTPIQDAISSGAANFSFAEIWGSVGNVVSRQPSLKFWAGNRYYRRHDIHLNDFFFSNMSGTGGGFEDMKLKNGKLAFAWIGTPGSSGVSSAPDPDAANKAGFSKTSFDLRFYDIDVPLGRGEVGIVVSRASSGLDSRGNTAPEATGFSGMFIHTRRGVFSVDGINKASIQFGTGAAKTLTSGFETFTVNGQSFIRADDPDSWRLRITENFTANLSDSFSLGPVFIYQLTDYAGDEGKVRWVSVGARPIWHIDQHISIALEAGGDWIDDDNAQTNGVLYKVTLAPQVSLGGRFMSRPVIRAFVTYAHWSEDFIGLVGGTDFANEIDGLTAGMHMEVWW